MEFLGLLSKSWSLTCPPSSSWQDPGCRASVRDPGTCGRHWTSSCRFHSNTWRFCYQRVLPLTAVGEVFANVEDDFSIQMVQQLDDDWYFLYWQCWLFQSPSLMALKEQSLWWNHLLDSKVCPCSWLDCWWFQDVWILDQFCLEIWLLSQNLSEKKS